MRRPTVYSTRNRIYESDVFLQHWSRYWPGSLRYMEREIKTPKLA